VPAAPRDRSGLRALGCADQVDASRMRFRVENLGPLREAEVDLGKRLIVLAGFEVKTIEDEIAKLNEISQRIYATFLD
jgi:hypothetical protein